MADTGRVGIICNGISYNCDIEDDEIYFAWLNTKMRELLQNGLSSATQLKFVFRPYKYEEAERIMG